MDGEFHPRRVDTVHHVSVQLAIGTASACRDRIDSVENVITLSLVGLNIEKGNNQKFQCETLLDAFRVLEGGGKRVIIYERTMSPHKATLKEA